jgi:SNF2 family DNA or RNA helicase
MEFLNPGFLGTQTAFKRSFFVPIQANRDREAAERLKRLTSPFILRRLKTDKTIIADLPQKMEMKLFCTLTKEQASLYAAVVKDMSRALEEAEGIKRKGLVLATLTRLKQIIPMARSKTDVHDFSVSSCFLLFLFRFERGASITPSIEAAI